MRAAAVAKAQLTKNACLQKHSPRLRKAEAQRDLQIKQANFLESHPEAKSIRRQGLRDPDQCNAAAGHRRAGQDRAGAKTGQIAVQEAEIQRRERELIATVLKQAEIERRKIEMLAEAQKQKLIFEARMARAGSSTRATGEAEARSFSRRASRSKGHEREGRSLPGLQPGGGHRQANQQHARDRQGTSLPRLPTWTRSRSCRRAIVMPPA